MGRVGERRKGGKEKKGHFRRELQWDDKDKNKVSPKRKNWVNSYFWGTWGWSHRGLNRLRGENQKGTWALEMSVSGHQKYRKKRHAKEVVEGGRTWVKESWGLDLVFGTGGTKAGSKKNRSFLHFLIAQSLELDDKGGGGGSLLG